MTTPRYRIGNDLTVFWAIQNRDGSPFDMAGMDIRLFVTNERGRKEVTPILTKLPDGTINNVIRWDFKGDDQRVLGIHTLTVEIQESITHREITKDYCEAFALVSRSEMETDEGDANITIGGDLILSSKLDIYRFEMTNADVAGIKESLNEVQESLADINEAIGDISEESLNIKVTINGIQSSVNDLGTEVKTKADATSVIELGEQITEVQTNVYEQTQRVDGLAVELSTKADIEDLDDVVAVLQHLSKMWSIDENGNLATDKQVVIKNNAIIHGDTASGGEGDTSTDIGLNIEQLEQYLDENKYVTEDDVKALIPEIPEIPEVDLSDYYTKEQVDDKVEDVQSSLDNYLLRESTSGQTIKGDIRIEGNLVVTGDTASGGEGDPSTEGGDIILDTEMSDTSTNAVQNKVIKSYVDEATDYYDVVDEVEAPDYNGSGSITIDAYMSDTSVNPVQNKVVKAYADKIDNKVTELGANIVEIDAKVRGNQESINALDGRIATAESALDSKANTDSVYAKGETYSKSEVDTKVSDLNSLIGAKASISTVEAISKRVTAAEENITSNDTDIENVNEAIRTLNATLASLQVLVNAIDEWKTLFGEKIVIDAEGNVNINTNLIVEGDTSSNG